MSNGTDQSEAYATLSIKKIAIPPRLWVGRSHTARFICRGTYQQITTTYTDYSKQTYNIIVREWQEQFYRYSNIEQIPSSERDSKLILAELRKGWG